MPSVAPRSNALRITSGDQPGETVNIGPTASTIAKLQSQHVGRQYLWSNSILTGRLPAPLM